MIAEPKCLDCGHKLEPATQTQTFSCPRCGWTITHKLVAQLARHDSSAHHQNTTLGDTFGGLGTSKEPTT